ncbi:uroporphyrinogen-III C-methyltransferase [Marinospirillum alkaliphilum]|uniref:uroporphyrinogen-III C-methyltransferase n=1 Tax=Marinospirillum alkaliphilum DSM 21637 TaxID=1122209 RepID=A0A1K1W3B2_9GAMM|nr:uroporphyrinogen-III C-methyltransferase [Marinospirillum alkaliphilum]SFX31866.1 uroporphyrin-III C-methyltransferase [Marinospirillum alkaliphilum DSM 21637]
MGSLPWPEFERPLGSLALVGAGPGDPELITRKGWRLLMDADVVVYDALVSDALLQELPATARRLYVGKRKGQHSMPQPVICQLLVDLARQGLQVVRLKGGDPLIFGRLTEETTALSQAGIPWQIVPGITAAAGCAAHCGFSLTERGKAPRLRLITAQSCDDRPIDWADLARKDETLVFYMGLAQVEMISKQLQYHGLPADWPVLLVEKGTQPEHRQIRCCLGDMLATVQEQQLQTPTLIYVGQVVAEVVSSQLMEPVNFQFMSA